MARIPLIERENDVPPGGEAAWAAIARSRGRVVGPFAALLHSPEAAGRVGHLGEYLRFQSAVAPAERELAILAVARTLDCRFEWAAHAPLARQAGVREEAIAAVREGRAPAGLTPEEAQVVAYARHLLERHRVDEATFGALAARLPRAGLVDLTATVGYYAMIACVLNAFEVTPAPGAEALPV
jgi:4-carboxymuconolactone decarboxylase